MEFNAILYGAGIVLLVCFGSILLCALLGLLGFTPAGIAAVSCASACQSAIGNVAAGSWFALLQSLGATGALLNWMCLPIIVATVTIIGLVYYLYDGDFGAAADQVNATTTAIVNNITEFSSNIHLSNLTEPMKSFVNSTTDYLSNIDYGKAVDQANATGTAIINNITEFTSNIHLSNITEPLNDLKSYFSKWFSSD